MKAIPNVYMRAKVNYRNYRVGSFAVIREEQEAFAFIQTTFLNLFFLTLVTLAVFITFSRMSAILSLISIMSLCVSFQQYHTLSLYSFAGPALFDLFFT
jgi:hypothetical protein